MSEAFSTGKSRAVYRAGDCKLARDVLDATTDGYVIGMAL